MFIGKGDLVRHPTMPSWGIGKVVKTVKGGNLLVSFDQAGNKLLHPEYAGLLKIPDDEFLYLVIRGVRIKKGRAIKTVRIIPVIKQHT
jgi:hypothetical protein